MNSYIDSTVSLGCDVIGVCIFTRTTDLSFGQENQIKFSLWLVSQTRFYQMRDYVDATFLVTPKLWHNSSASVQLNRIQSTFKMRSNKKTCVYADGSS